METNYDELAKQTYDQVMQLKKMKKEDDWTLYEKQPQYITFTRFDENHLKMSLTEAIILAPMDVIIELLKDVHRRKEFDDNFDGGDDVKIIDEFTRIITMKIKLNMFVSSRDVVLLTKAFIDKDTGIIVIIAKSIEIPEMPVNKDYVRAEVIVGAWILKPMNEHKTDLTYISLVDPKGYIPTALVNLSPKFQGAMISNLIKVVTKK